MTTLFENLVQKSINQPRSLFILDGLGAVLSAVLLGLVLVSYEHIFGMPAKILYILAFWPCLFALFDFASAIKTGINYSAQLKIIAMANLSYCLLSVVTLIFHIHTITIWGICYFVSELAIVILLVTFEFEAAERIEKIGT